MPRRFPPPWSIEERQESFVVTDANGQHVAYVYFEDESQRRLSMKRLTRDEAFLIAVGAVSASNRRLDFRIRSYGRIRTRTHSHSRGSRHSVRPPKAKRRKAQSLLRAQDQGLRDPTPNRPDAS